jgi:hypothetical protein
MHHHNNHNTSHLGSDALITRTALWVGKLRRERPPVEVALPLREIARTRPEVAAAMESHFRGFCVALPHEEVTAWWTVEHCYRPESLDPTDEALCFLRAMYWDDNSDDCKLETRGYENMKHYIEYELGFWKCANPVGYIRVDDKTGEICILSQNKIRDLLVDKYYYQPSQSTRVESVSIGPRWIADEHKRAYDRIVVDPTMKHAKGDYNMWTGFIAEKLPPVPAEEVHDLVQPMLKHVFDVLAAGDTVCYKYIVDWMAFLVQKPERRTQTLLLFYGQQGAGKGIIWDFLREKVLGPHVCTQTANARNDLFDRFSNGFLHKRFVQLDEAQDIRAFEDDLKNKVTARELRYEKKNQDTITVPNFANFVMTTNNMVTLRVASDDRRLAMFSCADAHRGNEAYFKALGKSLEHPATPRAVYQFFMARDLSFYTSEMSFQAARPITDFYAEARNDSLRPEFLFLSGIVNHFPEAQGVVRILIPELYNAYKAFVAEGFGTESRPMHHTTFGRFMGKMTQAVEKDRGGKTYSIRLVALRKFLQKCNSFDPEALLATKPACMGNS